MHIIYFGGLSVTLGSTTEHVPSTPGPRTKLLHLLLQASPLIKSASCGLWKKTSGSRKDRSESEVAAKVTLNPANWQNRHTHKQEPKWEWLISWKALASVYIVKVFISSTSQLGKPRVFRFDSKNDRVHTKQLLFSQQCWRFAVQCLEQRSDSSPAECDWFSSRDQQSTNGGTTTESNLSDSQVC